MDMNKFEEYDKHSRRIIDNSEVVSNFVNDVNDKIDKLSDIRFNKSIFYKLAHPVKVIKNNREYKKVKLIKDRFDYLYKSHVLYFVKEETGDLDIDLKNAAEIEKPAAVENYVKTLKLKK